MTSEQVTRHISNVMTCDAVYAYFIDYSYMYMNRSTDKYFTSWLYLESAIGS